MNRYGLIGFPLSHSFSQRYFAKKFQEQGINDCVYENFPLEKIEDIIRLVAEMPDLKGLNVTIPYKEKVLPYLSDENDIVKEIGACNCIKLDGKNLIGYNTDAIGFEKSFVPHLQSNHAKALVLGEGGAAKAVVYVLTKLGIEYLTVVRRGTSNINKVLYADLPDDLIESHNIIVNTTPLGMYPNSNECPPINYDKLTSAHYLYDVVYNPDKTLFLQKGEEKGAATKNGYEMLVLQAEESWRIWNEQNS
jgi:shikimate dehydrogenase